MPALQKSTDCSYAETYWPRPPGALRNSRCEAGDDTAT